ncbi:MAG: hypothetical protein QXN96_02355 [Candidatus Bathyarchaeia archaeon]
MKNKTLFKTIVKITLFSLVLAMSMFQFSILPAKAAALINISDTMSRLKASTPSNHAFKFTTPSGAQYNETITITFPAGFTMGSVDYTDIEVKDDNVSLSDAANCAGNEQAGISVSGQVITIEICDGDGGEIAGNSVVEVLVGTNANGGDAQVTNSTAGDNKVFYIAGTFGDTGSLAVSIVSDDQIVVTATVEPTFTFTLERISMTFGSFTTPSLRYANNSNGRTDEPPAGETTTATVSTNANNGVVITIRDEGNGTNAGLYSSGVNHLIEAAASSNVIGGTSESYGVYGTRASDLTVDEGFDNDGNNDAAISRSAHDFASASGPVNNAHVDVVYVARTVNTTPAGAYADTVTLIATGTF